MTLATGVATTDNEAEPEIPSAEAVIVASEVEVTSGPGAQYVTEFTLHNGAEVNLVEARGNWVRQALPGAELEGWVPASAIEPISG